MLEVTPELKIPDEELSWAFSRSGGPGGQNVNKVSSKAQLRWSMKASVSVPEELKTRLSVRHPSHVTIEGDFIVTSQESRVQERNREICLEKLRNFLLSASIVPKTRRKTKPSKASQRRRIEDKKMNATKKTARKFHHDD